MCIAVRNVSSAARVRSYRGRRQRDVIAALVVGFFFCRNAALLGNANNKIVRCVACVHKRERPCARRLACACGVSRDQSL